MDNPNEQLFQAIKQDDPQAVYAALAGGADANSIQDYHSALTSACFNGNKEIAFLLLEHGADPNLVVENGLSAFMEAWRVEAPEICQKLLDYGADVNYQTANGWTALMDNQKELGTVRFLLENGADPNLQDEEGYTPLYNNCWDNEDEIIALLLEYGADPNLQNHEYGSTALMVSAREGSQEMVRALLEHGADPNIINNFDYTALMFACQNPEKAGNAELLLDAGADPDILSEKDNASAFSIACAHAADEKWQPILGRLLKSDLEVVRQQGPKAALLDPQGKPTELLEKIIKGGAVIQQVFAPDIWEGQSGKALLDVYHALPQEAQSHVQNRHQLYTLLNAQSQEKGIGR